MPVLNLLPPSVSFSHPSPSHRRCNPSLDRSYGCMFVRYSLNFERRYKEAAVCNEEVVRVRRSEIGEEANGRE